MGSGFCRKRKTPLSFENPCSFISLPSVHFSVEIPILRAHYIPCLLTSPGPTNDSHYPCSLTLDLSCSRCLTPAVDPGKPPSWGAPGERGGRTEDCIP